MTRNLKSNYPKLNDQEVLDLVVSGKYSVDTELGIVCGCDGKQLAIQEDRKSGCKFVQLYNCTKRRTISLGLLVWMVRTNTTLPPYFEVHHLDKCKSNCRWDNLIALHHTDHDKYHALDFDHITIDNVPF